MRRRVHGGWHGTLPQVKLLAPVALVLCCLFAFLHAPASSQAQGVEEVDPAAEEAFFTGVALLEAGDFRGAIERFDFALRLQSDLRRVHYYRARAWNRLGDVSSARKDADAYGRYPLEAAEKEQLQALREEIEARAKALAAPAPSAPTPTTPTPTTPAPSSTTGIERLNEAEGALARGDCKAAEAAASAAMVADNTLARAFLIKGLALECLGEASRARDLLGMYRELRQGMPDDPVATAALARLSGARAGVPTAPPPAPAAPKLLGKDDRIQGILDERFGATTGEVVNAKNPKNQYVAGVGRALVGTARMRTGGSNATAGRAWVIDPTRGLLWSRVRITDRSGPETPDWLARTYAEFHAAVLARSGPPSKGPKSIDVGALESSPAMAGKKDLVTSWKDDDGDTILLRLGRCVVHGDDHPHHPDTQRCVELVGASGLWTPSGGVDSWDEVVERMEAPGERALDFAVAAGAGFGVDAWDLINAPEGEQGAFGGQVNGDLMVRFAKGAFVFGAAFAGGIAGHTGQGGGTAEGSSTGSFPSTLDVEVPDPLVDLRVYGQVGVRVMPRARTHTDITIGLGVANDERPAFAGALRISAFTRLNDVARFHVGFEPGVVIGQNARTYTVMRLIVGVAFGTKSRPVFSGD